MSLSTSSLPDNIPQWDSFWWIECQTIFWFEDNTSTDIWVKVSVSNLLISWEKFESLKDLRYYLNDNKELIRNRWIDNNELKEIFVNYRADIDWFRDEIAIKIIEEFLNYIDSEESCSWNYLRELMTFFYNLNFEISDVNIVCYSLWDVLKSIIYEKYWNNFSCDIFTEIDKILRSRVSLIFEAYVSELKNLNNWLTFTCQLMVEDMKKMYEDGLTWIHNRKYFEEKISEYLSRFMRLNQPFSILFIDLDHFKKINDSYWHNKWDEVLIKVSNVIKKRLRENDIFCRWWWEEFAIILEWDWIEDAKKVAESIRELIKWIDFSNINSSFSASASIGVTTVTNSDDKKSLLERVDKAMYKAKELWRNRVVVFDSEGYELEW